MNPPTRRASVNALDIEKYTTDGHWRGWSFHLCPDKEEREEFGKAWYGPPRWRVHVNTPWLHVAVALTDKARFAGRSRPHIREQYSALLAMRHVRMIELGMDPYFREEVEEDGTTHVKLGEPWWKEHRDDPQLAHIATAIKGLEVEKNRYPATWVTWGRNR